MNQDKHATKMYFSKLQNRLKWLAVFAAVLGVILVGSGLDYFYIFAEAA